MTDVIRATTLRSDLGELTVLERDGVVVSAGFGAPEEMFARLATDAPLRLVRDLGDITRAVSAYFAGDIRAVDSVAVDQPGGAFRQAAWTVMRDVPAGQTITYAELAERAGSPRAVRAAGSACARNLVAVLVPCHRIVRTGGALGGYYYGLSTKQRLLAHERRSLTRG